MYKHPATPARAYVKPAYLVDREYVWKRFRLDQARRERPRLIRLGVITPVEQIKPTMLYKNDQMPSGWSTVNA